MLLASFEQMVAKLLLNSFDSTVGFVVDTPFTFRDLTDSFPAFLGTTSANTHSSQWSMLVNHGILTLLIYILLQLFFQLYLGMCERTILFCARALLINLIDVCI